MRTLEEICTFEIHGTPKEQIQNWVRNTLSDHKTRKFEIAINPSDLYKMAIEGLTNGCAYCGQEMRFKRPGNGEQNYNEMLTLDILNPTRRVISIDNIRIVCYQCNVMKRSFQLDEFIAHCGAVWSHAE